VLATDLLGGVGRLVFATEVGRGPSAAAGSPSPQKTIAAMVTIKKTMATTP
jgi:hypothetical protein